MAPECLRRTQLSEIGWQSIPHSWSGDTECSVSELPICPWHDEIAMHGSPVPVRTKKFFRLWSVTVELVAALCP